MKLSKKNAARQRVLQKAIASGKTLGGLLVGFVATVTGCGRHSPAITMGRFPDPNYQENATNENAEVLVTEGKQRGQALRKLHFQWNKWRIFANRAKMQGEHKGLSLLPISQSCKSC